MAGKDYDVAAAFQAIEYELINSFFRNMKKHKVDEVKEQKQWEMWQVKQLQELDLYKKRNAEKYGTKFTDINKTIAEMIRLSNEEGQMDQEAEILSAMEKGLRPQRAPEQMTAQFFRTNDRKLDTLINATVSDMERAEVAVLRKADDVYRKTIFNAMVYANTGAGTYEKAVDMATKDFMKAGLTCVEYKNGSKHTISDYADMAVRTANKRAYLQGEGAKRQEWGIHTVIVNKRLMACPHCMPFAGKVFIDDVWGGGTAADGDYPLLSEAVAAGLYHPRCKDSHTTYFPGITGKPKKYTKAEVKEAEKAEEQERKADYAERQAESYQRVADTRLDIENKRLEGNRARLWSKKADALQKTPNEGKIEKSNNASPSIYFAGYDSDGFEYYGIGDSMRSHREDTPAVMVNYVEEYSKAGFIKKDINSEYPLCYDYDTDFVLVNPSIKGFNNIDLRNGIIHEIAHRIDNLKIGCISDRKFLDTIEACGERVIENQDRYKQMFEIGGEWFYNESVSDLFGCLTMNQISGFYAHDIKDLIEYEPTCYRHKEIFADIFTILYRADNATVGFVKTELPELVDAFYSLFGG